MIDIAQLKALENARTHRLTLVACEYHRVVHLGGCVGPPASLSDLEYVAAVVNALPELLALLEEARRLALRLRNIDTRASSARTSGASRTSKTPINVPSSLSSNPLERETQSARMA